ncbi:MAG: flagellar motor switch protein FliN [Candidatus Fermentithermobacillus carboniphilus]|uniref:Flagellar motor switch protein FliN n=1 Tax=Candidatus Fermentithermobacillus carboniphilus TaxID=3085328 RepID=A0AAT9LBX4_9FIRM|nr:MAG: flagellar motor switch protein FliN [Candidatus Fermentithermobacillus carboniphilus]
MKEETLTPEEIEALFKAAATQGDLQDPGKEVPHPGPSEPKQPEPVQDSRGVGSHEEQSRTPTIRAAVFEELPKVQGQETPISGMDVLMDIPLSISVELGKARCYVKDLLNLTTGSIVELDRLAGDPVDILVNGKLFARGEVVVIDENFGVRIQEIVTKKGSEKARDR